MLIRVPLKLLDIKLLTTHFLPKKWKRFTDDTCVIWPHGHEKLDLFLNHLNSLLVSIKSTMEVEENGCLPFLEILLSRMDNGFVCHQVFQKKTHMEQHLHAISHHFSAYIFWVLSTLATRALRISDDSHLEQEKSHLLEVFGKNGYSRSQSLKAFHKACKFLGVKHARVDPITKVHLSYI